MIIDERIVFLSRKVVNKGILRGNLHFEIIQKVNLYIQMEVNFPESFLIYEIEAHNNGIQTWSNDTT